MVEKKKKKKKLGDSFTFQISVNCTFVSSTDMILSLASLTLSLFPHTLMCGSETKSQNGDLVVSNQWANKELRSAVIESDKLKPI